MSITFSVQGSKTKVTFQPCTFGLNEEWACTETNRCGYCKDGVEEVYTTDSPEANFSNANAAALLRSLGVREEDTSYGEIAHSDLPTFRREIFYLMNQDLKSLEIPYSDTKRPGFPRVIQSEVTSESMLRRLRQLDEVCRAAQDSQAGVRWG